MASKKKSVSDFTTKECVSYGWETTKRDMGFLFPLQLIMGGVILGMFLISLLLQLTHQGFADFLVKIVMWVIDIVMGIGLIGIALKYVDKKKARYQELWGDIRLFWSYLGGAILYALIVIGGLILLIVPGFIWGVKFQFWKYFVVEKKMGPVEALKASARITAGRKGGIFVFDLALIGIEILGFLALIVGIFWACPTVFISEAYAYRKLSALTRTK